MIGRLDTDLATIPGVTHVSSSCYERRVQDVTSPGATLRITLDLTAGT